MDKTTFDHLDEGDWFVEQGKDSIYMKTNNVDGCYSCVNVLTGRISPIAWSTEVVYVESPKIYMPEIDWENL